MLSTDYSAPLSWLSFFMVSIAVSLLWLGVKLLFNFFLRSFSYTHKIVSVNNLILADRIFRIFLSSILLIAFILINPKIHGILIAILLFLTYPLLKDLFIGFSIIPKINLLRDNYIQSGTHEGTIRKLRWLGIILGDKFNEKYVPYSYLYNHGFEQKGNNYTTVLRFSLSGSESRSVIRDAILRKIFIMPFLAKGSNPELSISDQVIVLKIDISNPKFEESIINAIEEIKIDNTTIKAI